MEGANLTAEEREIVRDFDAYAWGSLDVSLEQLLSKLHELTPEGRKRVGAAIGERVRATQGRERNLEQLEPSVARLERLTELLEELIERLDPPAAD
jgi:hypothetical protein